MDWTEAELQLHFAAARNDINTFNTILNDHPETNPGGYRDGILIMASWRGYTTIVERILLDDRVAPGVQSNSALECAVMRGRLSVVQCLLDDVRVDPSAENNYLLLLARACGHGHVAELLLTDARVSTLFSETAEHS